jgi:hypothetical protein
LILEQELITFAWKLSEFSIQKGIPATTQCEDGCEKDQNQILQ